MGKFDHVREIERHTAERYKSHKQEIQEKLKRFRQMEHFSGKTIIPFATSGMSGIGDSGKNMHDLAKGATVLPGMSFKNSVSSGEPKTWVQVNELIRLL